MQFQLAVANDAVEDAFLRDKVALILGHKRPGLAQLDRVADFGVAFVPDGQRVDRLLEGLNQRLGGGQFRQVAQCVGVFQFHRAVKQLLLHKRLDLAIQHVIAADQAQILHDGLRKVADHAAVVGNAGRVENRGMRNLAGGDVLEDDLPLLFFAELQVQAIADAPSRRRPDRPGSCIPGRRGASAPGFRCPARRCLSSRSPCQLRPPAESSAPSLRPSPCAPAPRLRPGWIPRTP